MNQPKSENKRTIEIEFRSMFTKTEYDRLKIFLNKNAKDLGEDDKDVYFFLFPDKLLKVVNNISKGSAKIVLKLNRIGKGSNFEEIEIPISQDFVEKAVEVFTKLAITDNIMHTPQTRNNYFYKGVEIALKWSPVWQYHLELEIVVNNESKKEKAEQKIRKVADELHLRLMTEEELAKFVEKVETENKKKNPKSFS